MASRQDILFGDIAKLVRHCLCKAEMREFESHCLHYSLLCKYVINEDNARGVRPALGAGSAEFNSQVLDFKLHNQRPWGLAAPGFLALGKIMSSL